MAAYVASGAGGGTSGSGNRSVTYTPSGTGNLLVCFVVVSGNTNDSPTMTDQGFDAGSPGTKTWTRILTVAKNASADRLSVFVRDTFLENVDAGTITAATGSNTAGELVVIEVSGMLRTGASAILQSASQANQSASTTPAPAFSASALTANMTMGAVGNGTNPATMTTASGWTERQDAGQNTPATGLEVITRDSGFTGTTITWGSTSGTAYADIIIELDNTAAPSGSLLWPTYPNQLLRM